MRPQYFLEIWIFTYVRKVWLLQVEWSGKSASKRSEKWKNKYRALLCVAKNLKFLHSCAPWEHSTFLNKITKILWVTSSFTIMDFNFISINSICDAYSMKRLWSFSIDTQKLLIHKKIYDRLINKLSTKKLDKNSKTDYARYYFRGNGNVHSIFCVQIEFYRILILSSNSVIIAFVI